MEISDDGKGNYDGREQALIKHTLLRSYLRKLFLIISAGSAWAQPVEFCYIDCFAGPWQDETENLSGTSIAISLAVLSECRDALSKIGRTAKIRALYVERDRKAFTRLSTYLNAETPAGIESHALEGDFVDLREAILGWVGANAFAFFFVDPMGWKQVKISVLEPLLKRPRSEFLINFMYDFVNRTMAMSQWQTEMGELVGESVALDRLSPSARESRILTAYRSNLKACVPKSFKFPARSAYVRVMNPKSRRTHYHLVYITSHPRGILEFMDISEDVNIVQRQVRVELKGAARERQSGITDMFSTETLPESTSFGVSADEVDAFWLQYLANGERRVGQPEFADIVEETDWFPSDLQASLLRLIRKNSVRNLDAIGKRPKKPLHLDSHQGERLIRIC